MNVLEKILEEIEYEIMTNKEVGRKQCEGMVRAINIIHKYTDEKTNINISTIAAINKEMEDYLFEKYCVEGFDEELDKIFKKYLELGKDISVSSNWISVKERLPEEHDSTFAIYKGTHLWSKSMFEKISDPVNVTYELEDRTRKTGTSYTLDGKWKIEKDRVVKKKVVAWQSLPEEYKGD